MSEKEYGNIIIKYPELIEAGLVLEGREVNVFNRKIDLLFKDEYNRQLIVELKVVPINDKHIGQIIDYYSALSKNGARLMLISPQIPFIKKNTLNNLGIEWKELTFEYISNFLINKNDSTFESNNNKSSFSENLNFRTESIITPFNNEIHFEEMQARIIFNDKYNIINPKNMDILTSIENANIYLKFEQRIFEKYNNPPYIVYTYAKGTEKSWGFGTSYRQSSETNEQKQFWSRLIWIHFTGAGKGLKKMQIDIPDKYNGYFKKYPSIPQKPENFKQYAINYLIIGDYLSMDTIDEIMEMICSINLDNPI